MLILAKAALGFGATLAMAGAYVFHEGVIRVDVDERRPEGSHVHFWVPATAVEAGMRLAPKERLQQAAEQARPYLPLIRELAKELDKYPNAELVDVTDENDHVRVSLVNGKLRIDTESANGDVVHISLPTRVLVDVTDNLEARVPGV